MKKRGAGSGDRPRLSISGGAFVLTAAGVLLLPLPWLAAALGAGTAHELGHLLALRAMGEPIREIRLGAFGAAIELDSLSPGRELVSAAAGPGAGLALVLLGRWMPRLAFCAAVQSAFNLLPIFPMDGGRIRSALGAMRKK